MLIVRRRSLLKSRNFKFSLIDGEPENCLFKLCIEAMALLLFTGNDAKIDRDFSEHVGHLRVCRWSDITDKSRLRYSVGMWEMSAHRTLRCDYLSVHRVIIIGEIIFNYESRAAFEGDAEIVSSNRQMFNKIRTARPPRSMSETLFAIFFSVSFSFIQSA